MTQEYKSFMTEGYSIGAHAESLYSRGYKHYGTMGQGNKQVHIFTPARGKADHHMLLKHDGADPVRHEGQPDLKKIKTMTETTDVIAIQKEKETKAQRQDRNIQEISKQKIGSYLNRAPVSQLDHDVDADEAYLRGDKKAQQHSQHKSDKRGEGIKKARERLKEDHLEEGWLFGSRYKRIGNKYATHRVTVKHMPTNTKHTFDVTAPTDRHAFDHVDRHMHGGRRGNTLSLVKIQHLHEEGKEVMAEALDIRHAINHPDSQARHHARKFKEHSKTANDIANMRVFPDQAYDYAHHYETAQHHAKKYKERLGQLEAGKNVKNEDLQEISQKTAQTAYRNRSSRADWDDEDSGHYDDHSWMDNKHRDKAEKTLGRIKKKFGDKAAVDAERGAKFDANIRTSRGGKSRRSKEQGGPGDYLAAKQRVYSNFSDPHWKKGTNQRKSYMKLNAGRFAKEDLDDLQEISKGLVARYLEKAKPAYDAKRQELNKPSYSGPVWGDMKGRIKKFSDQVDKLGRRREGINRAQSRLKEEGLQELSKKTLGSYVKKAHASGTEAARDHEQASNSDRAYDRAYGKRYLNTLTKRRKGVDMATDKLTKEENETQKPHPKGTKVIVTHKGHQKPGRVIRHDPGGPDSSPFYVVDVGEYGSGKFMAHHVRKEDLDEGLYGKVQRIKKSLDWANRRDKAWKGAHDKLDTVQKHIDVHDSKKYFKARRDVLRYVNTAQGRGMTFGTKKEDLDEGLVKKIVRAVSGRAEAARRAERHYDQGDDVWGGDEGKTFRRNYKAGYKYDRIATGKPGLKFGSRKPQKMDNIDQPMFRKPGSSARKFKSEDLVEGLVSRIKNAAKNLNKRLTPTSERIAKTREKVGYDNAKGTDLRPRGKALRKVERIEWSKQNPKKKLKDIVPMGKLPDKVWEDRNKFKNDHDDEVSKTITKHGEPSSKKHSYDSMSDHHVTELGYPKKTVSVVTKRYKGGRLASHGDLTADSAHSVFVQNMKSEELEPNGSRKLLKELPKRDPKTGRLAKSKTAQKVEDCIKMSGKKEKIDTEPSYNPLTTAGGGGTPNA